MTMYEQYGSIKQTRLYGSCCRTLHLLTVQAFSVLKYFHSNLIAA